MEYWYWYHRYYDRMYGQTLFGHLLHFAMTPLVLTTKTLILPFNLISQKLETLREQKQQDQILHQLEPEWNQNQKALENISILQQKLQQVKLNNQVLIVLTQRSLQNKKTKKPQDTKGCIIVASNEEKMLSFYPHLRKFMQISQTESISFYQKNTNIWRMVSPGKLFSFMQKNEQGFIELQFMKQETMG